MRKQYFILAALLCIAILLQTIHAQMPAKDQNQVGLKQEYYGGLNLHSSGWGLQFNYAKFATYKSNKLFNFEFVSMKHPKEVKTKGFLSERTKEYVFGKLNSFSVMRLGYGKKIQLSPKLREKGVQVSLNYLLGMSLGILRPIYLDVLQDDGYGGFIPRVEIYNPERHNIGNIYGRARGNFRLQDLKLHPGLYSKIGLQFEFGDYRDVIRAIEVGVGLDGYYKKVPIMAFVNNQFLYPTVYLNLQIGSRAF